MQITDKERAMADDVQPITGTVAATAMRLCNFATATAVLLPKHIQRLDSDVAPVIRDLLGPWVDLFGYASRVGDLDFNLELSRLRVEAVRSHLARYSDAVHFQIQTAYGESQSMGEPDNTGDWGAVELYVYATRPPSPPVAPLKPSGSTRFEIRLVGGGSAAILLGSDHYIFQIVDLVHSRTAFFLYTEGGVSISFPKIPGPGSMTYSGPPKPFKTALSIELYQFKSKATLVQDTSVELGSLSVGGLFRLSIDEIQNDAGTLVETLPSIIPIEGGPGISMPGFGSATSGVLALVSEVFPFTGY